MEASVQRRITSYGGTDFHKGVVVGNFLNGTLKNVFLNDYSVARSHAHFNICNKTASGWMAVKWVGG